jgi:GT2 family glycosyltransferase
MAMKAMSVVVLSHDSSTYLRRLLESIAEADDRASCEVIIVDDSGPAEAHTTAGLCRLYDALLVVKHGNVPSKRNAGVAAATSNMILFVDSDCRINPRLFVEHRRLALMADDIGAMLGAVDFEGERSLTWRMVERSQFLGAFGMARRMDYAPWGVTCNLSVRRDAFNATGGFDEGLLPVTGGDDVDFGLRLNRAGYRIRCNPSALVFHTRDTWNSFGRMMRRVFNYGRNHFLIMTKHASLTGREYPRILPTIGLIAIATLLSRLLRKSAALALIGAAVYCVAALVTVAILLNRRSRSGVAALPFDLGGVILECGFEAGLLFESVRRRSLDGFWRKVIYARGQLLAERDRKVLLMWSLLLSALPVFLW